MTFPRKSLYGGLADIQHYIWVSKAGVKSLLPVRVIRRNFTGSSKISIWRDILINCHFFIFLISSILMISNDLLAGEIKSLDFNIPHIALARRKRSQHWQVHSCLYNWEFGILPFVQSPSNSSKVSIIMFWKWSSSDFVDLELFVSSSRPNILKTYTQGIKAHSDLVRMK